MKFKKSLEGLNRRMEMAEEIVHDLEDKIIQSEIQRKFLKKMSRNSGTCGTI